MATANLELKAPQSLFRQTFVRFRQNPTGRLGGVLFIGCVVVAVFAAQITPHGPLEMIRGNELVSPSTSFPLGTDEFGRDLLSRIIFGMRTSLTVSFLAVLVGGVPGIITGLYTGYSGGPASTLIMRLLDGLLAFPPMLLAIMFAAMLGAGPTNAAIALGIISIPEFSRIVRSAVLVEKEREFALASKAIGARPVGIIFRHILPNVISPILVHTTLMMGAAIALEAALSFIGLGIQPPDPSLGSMLNQSRKYMYSAWWYAIFPGIAIALVLLSLNWFSEALMEALDPRSER